MDTIQKILKTMEIRFGKISVKELTDESKEEIISILKQVAINGYFFVKSWEVMESAEKFFYTMKPVLQKWSEERIIEDREILRVLARAVIDLYLEKEQLHKFCKMVPDSYTLWKRVYEPSRCHIANCQRYAAELMASLRFYNDAIDYAYDAAYTSSKYSESEKESYELVNKISRMKSENEESVKS